MLRIWMIGSGWVGLVSGACFAEMGHQVTCFDINHSKIAALQRGEVQIFEPRLAELVHRNQASSRLHFTTDFSPSFADVEICFLTVDTPSLPGGDADLSQIEQAARSIGKHLQKSCVVAVKSTVPVGTSHRVWGWVEEELQKRGCDFSVSIASNPEFLKEGSAVEDFLKPDRVVVGAEHPDTIAQLKALYTPFMLNHERLLVMDLASAELSKYAANAMLATRISFMNEIASLAEALGADVGMVRKAMGMDERIGPFFLYPGVGYGGSCLPKDVKSLLSQAHASECLLEVVSAAHRVNQRQKQLMGQKINHYFADKGGLHRKVFGILGLSFKPDTNDMREASSLPLIHYLLSEGAEVQLFDPVALPQALALLPHSSSIVSCSSESEASLGADALVLMTEWKQFRVLHFPSLLAHMRGRAFFDGRNQYQPDQMQRLGFDYISIGRPPVYAATPIPSFPL